MSFQVAPRFRSEVLTSEPYLLQYIMMLDVDFWLCTDFRSRMLSSPDIMDRLRGGLAAFVVPAFEFHKQSDGVDPTTFPSTKEASRGTAALEPHSRD